jgi:DNA-binding PadR family transcriptional regulator
MRERLFVSAYWNKYPRLYSAWDRLCKRGLVRKVDGGQTYDGIVYELTPEGRALAERESDQWIASRAG